MPKKKNCFGCFCFRKKGRTSKVNPERTIEHPAPNEPIGITQRNEYEVPRVDISDIEDNQQFKILNVSTNVEIEKVRKVDFLEDHNDKSIYKYNCPLCLRYFDSKK